jgi:hypothetical protein
VVVFCSSTQVPGQQTTTTAFHDLSYNNHSLPRPFIQQPQPSKTCHTTTTALQDLSYNNHSLPRSFIQQPQPSKTFHTTTTAFQDLSSSPYCSRTAFRGYSLAVNKKKLKIWTFRLSRTWRLRDTAVDPARLGILCSWLLFKLRCLSSSIMGTVSLH